MNSPANNAVYLLENDATSREEMCGELLKAKIPVSSFSQAEDLLAAIQEPPAVYLLQQNAIGMSGLDICRQLRDHGNSSSHIILCADSDDIQLRLSAFDAGCNDYCVKPLIPEEIVRKVDAVIKTNERLLALSSSLEYANGAAFSAMSSMAEMGTVMNFMRTVFECASPEKIAQAIIATCQHYELSALVGLCYRRNWCLYNSQGAANSLESSLLEHARQNDRVTQFARRLSISYPHITLLITNWPKDDADRAGRLRDHLALIAEAANIRVGVLQLESGRIDHANMILDAVNGLMRMVDYLRERQSAQRERAMRMVADQGEAIALSFYNMGLSDAQEETILSLVSGCGNSICEQMAAFGLEQEQMLEGIIETMKHLADE